VGEKEDGTGSLHPPVKYLAEQGLASKETIQTDYDSAKMITLYCNEEDCQIYHNRIANQY